MSESGIDVRTAATPAVITQRRLTLALLAAGLATFSQLYAIQGALPQLARELGASPSEAALTISLATGGLAASVIPWAFAADRIGKIPAMRIAAIGSIVLALAVVVAPTVEVLLVARFLGGAVLGAVPALSIAVAYERMGGRAAAAVAAAYIAGTSVGGAAGRLVVGPIAPLLGWRWALLVVAVLGAVSVAVFLVATRGRGTVPPVPDAGSRRRRLVAALRSPGLWPLYAQALLLVAVQVGVYNYLAFRLEAAPYGLAPAVASLIFVAYAAGTVASRCSSWFVARIGARWTMVAGHGALLVGLVMLALQPLPLVIAGLVVATTGFFVAHATAASQVGARSAPGVRSQSGALYNIGFYVGSAVGGWALGLPFEAGGWAPFTVAALGLVIASLVLALAARGEPRGAADADVDPDAVGEPIVAPG
ncbi:MFS transporter [Agrococcus sp. ARC_14]|uniref:MFS transporter n=1 Tax=Agrococcus sp. ARC_14 TaxID=2919927 RepID=UPI001F0549EA|nr:MFS transporter [Agrococcus sp. ARC_14]